ncbi:UNKNOWN [Stylonychia lemnae]|uniref:Progesterone-induced-blocking factor 1 n=1 Tax=Stylonychia lemnae TaxID=5949 RepID=A0A078AX68_STYLE|nr:UNKNOWN [Stylonychia lemnae]|eukprot:CDW86764.1 UNKNOWN [Stylonychia lemnae]
MQPDQFDDNLLGSGRNPLIPRSQVLDVLKNLNIKEGIFTEDELRQLENGYSVSETDGDDNDMMSVRSGQSNHLGARSIQSPMTDFYENMGRQARTHHGRFTDDLINRITSQNEGHIQSQPQLDEQRLRMNQERSMLHAEIATQKSKYLKRMTNLERLLDQLKSEKRELQSVIETQKQNFKLQLVQQDQKTQDQLREIKEQQYKLQGQVPQFKEKLDMYKKELTQSNLIISEETYVELKAKHEDQKSLKEYLQVRIYEQLDKYHHEIENLRRSNDELVEVNMNLKMKSDRDQREIESLKKIAREREEDSRRRIDALERRTKELEQDLHRVTTQNKVMMEKGISMKEVDEHHKQLEIDYRSLQNKHKMVEDQLLRLQDQKLEVERRSESLRREIDILNQDKTFLTRENVSIEERYKRVEDKLDRTEAELLEQKRIANNYMERVLSTNDDVKGKFEQQYTQEINDLKDRHARELDLAKQNLTDIYEKRLDYMRELKDSYERRIMKLEQDYTDKNKSYEELLMEYRQLQKTADEEIGRTKLAVASRGDECQRIRHLYEDNMLLVKDLKIENEALKSKIDILKSEYYKLESMNRQGNADIKAELAVCKERLGNYELIEKELDQAIMNVANNDNIDGDPIDSVGNALIQTITSAPTTAKRRIQQSLLLANRLQSKQKEVEALQKEIKTMKDKLENYESELKFQKRVIDKTNQPASYMMADLEKSERELQFASKKIKKLEEEIKRLNKDNDALVQVSQFYINQCLLQQKKGLADDLQKLMAKRQDIENLQTALQGIISHSSNRKIDVDELKHKLADSIRQNMKGNKGSFKENSQKRFNKSRSRSPRQFLSSYDEIPEKGSAVKHQQDPDVPAWYKSLQKHNHK